MGGGGGCTVGRMINLLITSALLGGAAYMMWHFLGQPDADEIKDAFASFGDFGDVLGNITNFDFRDLYDQDPFLSDNSTNSWSTKGEGGLELELVNALDDTWQEEFVSAVDDWENGDPDALTLSVTRGDIDYICTQKTGVQKVCAGNYGESGWLGINEILKNTRTSVIQSSVAKMNEYYLRNADRAERQYTMCHEIGHGFGLPHTDESFTNPSLGNCMDYTRFPEENMRPDETNFKRLAGLYGTVGQRRLRRIWQNGSESRSRSLSKDLQVEYQAAIEEIEQIARRRQLSSSGWRLLQEDSGGASYQRKLGGDHIIEVQMLYTISLN